MSFSGCGFCRSSCKLSQNTAKQCAMSSIWPKNLADDVAQAVLHAAHAELLPRFSALHALSVQHKASADDPDDLVTEADHAVEQALSPLLQRLLPGSQVLGEEACHANPQLLAQLEANTPLWVLDPLDGTRNFAGGSPQFGVMLALV